MIRGAWFAVGLLTALFASSAFFRSQLSRIEGANREVNARYLAAKEESRSLEQRIQELETQVERVNAENQRLLDQRDLIFELAASTTVSCVKSTGLRFWADPELDPNNPRIGTLIRLEGIEGERIEFTNPDLSVNVREQDRNRFRLHFEYQPLSPREVYGRPIDEVISTKTHLVVRYERVLRKLGFIINEECVVADFGVTINGIKAVSMGHVGPIEKGQVETRFQVGSVLGRTVERYRDRVVG